MFQNAEIVSHMDNLRKFAMRLTRNASDAEDLLQSTILRAIEKKHLFKEGTNLYSWASKIMFNLFASAYRRKTKFETQYDPENYIQNQKVDAQQETEMELKNVTKAMDTLSEDHKDILVMVCIKGMQYAEVAKILDIPVGTVRSRLFRARESLQAELDTTNFVPHVANDTSLSARAHAQTHRAHITSAA